MADEKRPGAAYDSDRALIEERLDELDVLRELHLDREEAMATAVTGFTVLHPDDKARAILRERSLAKIDEAMRGGRWFEARLRVENLLTQASAANVLGWKPDEIASLGEKLGEIRAKSRSGSE